jgi:hypothetical protein
MAQSAISQGEAWCVLCRRATILTEEMGDAVRTYYRSVDVLITDEVFAVREPVPMRFRLERLRGTHIVADDALPTHLLAVMGVALTFLLGGFAVSRLHSFLDQVTVAVLGVVVLVAIGVRWRGRSRGRELRAIYGGDEVRLFRSTDPMVFGQVRRGLIRALEDLEPASTGPHDR